MLPLALNIGLVLGGWYNILLHLSCHGALPSSAIVSFDLLKGHKELSKPLMSGYEKFVLVSHYLVGNKVNQFQDFLIEDVASCWA